MSPLSPLGRVDLGALLQQAAPAAAAASTAGVDMPLTLQIFVKCGEDATFSINADWRATIGGLKALIFVEKSFVPLTRMNLLFGGKFLEDAEPLRRYNIQRESTLHLVLSPVDGQPACQSLLPRHYASASAAWPERREPPPRAAERPPCFQLYVKSVETGLCLDLNISNRSTLGELKQAIAARWSHLSPARMRLLHAGLQLDDNERELTTHGIISKESTLILLAEDDISNASRPEATTSWQESPDTSRSASPAPAAAAAPSALPAMEAPTDNESPSESRELRLYVNYSWAMEASIPC